MLQNKKVMTQYLTQNIDNLESRCGFTQEDLVQAHGANFGATCSKCGKAADRKKLEEGIKTEVVYRCEKEDCDGPIKPDITFFGEGLPDCFF
jgi:NAD-dependent SIR2 family protein deacetylase